MNELPKGFTTHQDLLMRLYLELSECPWHDSSKLPKTITKTMAKDWYTLNGYTVDKTAKIGWRKKSIRRAGDEE